ncbi:unnamed protein product [Mortierella alpina]
MRNILSLALIGLLAAVGSSAPRGGKDAHALVRRAATSTDADATFRPRPASADAQSIFRAADLNIWMMSFIKFHLPFDFNKNEYRKWLRNQTCPPPKEGKAVYCEITIEDGPKIEYIPTRAIAQDYACSDHDCNLPTPGMRCDSVHCDVRINRNVSVATTHSADASLLLEADAQPFEKRTH